MRKRHRKASVQAFSRPSSAINVTPLVDVVLVLLIIFMVVTPLLDKDIEIAIPKTEQVETTDDVPDQQLLVRVAADGTLTINDRKVTLEEYVAALKLQMDNRTEAMKVIFLQIDDDAIYGRVVQAIDLAKGAGVLVVGVSTVATAKE
ncbi:MAG: biopolymer transporter ExbD [Deltaproteobacteria bacterium]|nr:biopolymer transporter ExbD [Deltaproteobacteria bacterium]